MSFFEDLKTGDFMKWLSEVRACFMPSIADLDQDGAPEVIDVVRIASNLFAAGQETVSFRLARIVSDFYANGSSTTSTSSSTTPSGTNRDVRPSAVVDP